MDTTQLTITIEVDERHGGYYAYFDDWVIRAGRGDTIHEAIIAAVEASEDFLSEYSEAD